MVNTGVVLILYKYSETSQIRTLQIWTSFCSQTWLETGQTKMIWVPKFSSKGLKSAENG